MTELPESERMADVADVVEAIKQLDGVWAVWDYKTKSDVGDEHTEVKVNLEIKHQPQPSEFDAPVVSAGFQDIQTLKNVVSDIEAEHEEGAPRSDVVDQAVAEGMNRENVTDALEQLRQQGDVYEPKTGHLRTV